jgi:hypothetical protein
MMACLSAIIAKEDILLAKSKSLDFQIEGANLPGGISCSFKNRHH